MVIVFGNVPVAPVHIAEALALAREHVLRSRTEPGCLSHAVYEDPDRPHQLVFVEEWASQEALQQHVALPASVAFGQALVRLADGRMQVRMFEATERPFPRPAR